MAQPLLQSAVALVPDWADAHFHLALALSAQGDLTGAEAALRRAIAHDDTAAGAMHVLGTILSQNDRLDEALIWLQRSVVLAPEVAAARRDLGIAQLFLGLVERAREQLQAAIDLDPTCPRVLPTLVELTPIARFPAEAARLAQVLEDLALKVDQLGPDEQSDLFLAIGRARDDAGIAGEAFEAFRRANALRRSRVEFDSDVSDQRLAAIQATFTPALMTRLEGQGDPSRRPIFIFGMPRSGTTLVEQIIAAHPRVRAVGETMAMLDIIASARGPDGAIYPHWAPALSGPNCEGLGQAYLATLPALSPGQTKTTDKRLENIEHLGLIHLALPNAALIHCLRDPRDTLFSCFATSFVGGQPWSYDLEDIGRYWAAQDRLVGYWKSVLPAKAILTVSYEALVDDLEAGAREIIAHCGLDWDPACLAFHKADNVVRSASAAQVRRPIYSASIGRWRPYEAYLAPLFQRLGLSPTAS